MLVCARQMPIGPIPRRRAVRAARRRACPTWHPARMHPSDKNKGEVTSTVEATRQRWMKKRLKLLSVQTKALPSLAPVPWYPGTCRWRRDPERPFPAVVRLLHR